MSQLCSSANQYGRQQSWNMEGCQQCALFVWRHKPNKLFFFIVFESSSNNLLEKFQFVDFWIAFLIASLRIDQWWISSQNHNLANLFVVVQSTNSISSRGQKTTFWAWTLAIFVGQNRSNQPSHTADRWLRIARIPARLGKSGRQQTTRKQ